MRLPGCKCLLERHYHDLWTLETLRTMEYIVAEFRSAWPSAIQQLSSVE